VEDMPHTLAALGAGVISEADATRVVRATTGLTGAQRTQVDHGLRADLGTTCTDRLAGLAAAATCQVAPGEVAARRKAAETDRRVRVRPAVDQMAWLSALLPVKDALACQAALAAAADSAAAAAQSGTRAGAGPVCRDRVMADTLVERVTGRSRAQDPLGVCVNLLMGFDTLFGDIPAHVPGYGPVPADLGREWVTAGDPTGPQLRRLFTHPGTGDIVGMDSRARRYPGLLARLILFRDHTCRTPWRHPTKFSAPSSLRYFAGTPTVLGAGPAHRPHPIPRGRRRNHRTQRARRVRRMQLRQGTPRLPRHGARRPHHHP